MSCMYNWGNMSKAVILLTSASSWQLYCITGFQHCFLQLQLIYKYLIIVEEIPDFTTHWQFQTSLKQWTWWRQIKKPAVHIQVYLEMPTKSSPVSLSPLYREGGGGGLLNLSFSSACLQVQGQYWCILHPFFFFGLPVQKPSEFSCKIERFSLLMTPTVFL